MKSIPAFRVGRHTSDAGQTIDFSDAEVAAIATGYDPALHEAPLVVGHPKTDDPAYGWVQAVTFAEGELVAEPHQVDPQFDEMVKAGRFKKISISLYPKNHPANPTPGEYYLRHVGFLGAQPPAIKGQRPIQYAENDDAEAITIEFGELSPYSVASLFSSLRDWMLAKFGAEDADRALPGYATDGLIADAARPNNESEISPAYSEQEAAVDKQALERERAALEAQRQAQEAKEANFAEREKRLAAGEAQAKRAEIVEFVESLVSPADGKAKILPRDKDGLIAFMAGDEEISFAEGDETVTEPAEEWLRKFLTNLPPAIDFAERAGAEDAGADAARYDAPAGYAVDPERAALHKKALAYAEQHKVDYITAVQALSN